MKIAVIGSGYVGLVTGACLADAGHHVRCVDIDEAKIEALRNGVIPIFEPGLEKLVLRNVRDDRLTFTTDAAGAIHFGDLVFIAVGTPAGEDGSADLSYVLGVAETIGRHIQPKVFVEPVIHRSPARRVVVMRELNERSQRDILRRTE